MNAPYRKQVTQYSRITNLQAQTENVGVLTPVHIQDIIKDRNLDYLQSLGQLAEKLQVNPVWFDYESNQNKVKLFEIYQLSINYGKNTQAIYGEILNQLNQQFQQKKNKVNKLKSDILTHKEKTTKLKKYYRKQRLNKQKQKVYNYQRSMKNLRDDMLRQKKQLEIKNQQYLNEQRKNNNRNGQNFQSGNHFNYGQQPNSQVFAYPPQSYAQFYPFAHPPPPQQSPIFTPHQQSGKNIFDFPSPNFNNSEQHQRQSSVINISTNRSIKNSTVQARKQPKQKKQSILILQQQQKQKQNNKDKKKSLPRKNSDSHFEKVDSVIQDEQDIVQQPKSIKMNQYLNGNMKNQNVRNTAKSYSFQQSGNIRSSNFESQKGDEVKDLANIVNQSAARKNAFQTKLSNKSVDFSENDLSSIMQIQLKTQSKNDLFDERTKTNNLSKQTSIIQQLNKQSNNKSAIKKKPTTDTNSKNIKTQVKKEGVKFKQENTQVKNYNDRMSIKISNVKSPEIIKSNNSNYLQKSNQGFGLQSSHQTYQVKHNLKLKLKQSNKLLSSVTNSLDDVQVQSRGGSKSVNQVDQNQNQYQMDFQDIQPELTENTRIKVNVEYSDEAPSAQRFHEFVPLFKNYFILKQDAKGLHQSSVSGVGSLKQLSVKFVGSERRKTYYDKSQKGASQSGDLQLIDMPQNSIIAKPSKLKKSTIHKSSKSIIHKKPLHSHDGKPRQFNTITPDKSVLRKGQKTKQKNDNTVQDNFKNIIAHQDLKSRRLTKNNDSNNFLRISKPQQALTLSLTQSHVIQQQKITQQRQSNQQGQIGQSIKLSVIPESQNQSQFNQNSHKVKILQLIQKKYSQKAEIVVPKDLIKNQIALVSNKNKDDTFSLQQIIEKFTQLSKIKQSQVNKLKEERKKITKQIKQQNSNKIPGKYKSDRSNTSNKRNNQVKSNQKLRSKEQDDLNYSQSMVQNVPSSKTNSKDSENAVKLEVSQFDSKKVKQKQADNKLANNSKTNEINQSKYTKQKKNDNENTRLLNKIIQASGYDKDDELENTIKANFQNKNKAKNKKEESDDEDF